MSPIRLEQELDGLARLDDIIPDRRQNDGPMVGGNIKMPLSDLVFVLCIIGTCIGLFDQGFEGLDSRLVPMGDELGNRPTLTSHALHLSYGNMNLLPL